MPDGKRNRLKPNETIPQALQCSGYGLDSFNTFEFFVLQNPLFKAVGLIIKG